MVIILFSNVLQYNCIITFLFKINFITFIFKDMGSFVIIFRSNVNQPAYSNYKVNSSLDLVICTEIGI